MLFNFGVNARGDHRSVKMTQQPSDDETALSSTTPSTNQCCAFIGFVLAAALVAAAVPSAESREIDNSKITCREFLASDRPIWLR